MTRFKSAARLGATIVAAVVLAACAVGKPHEPPTMPATPAWAAPLPHGGDTARLTDWWSRFDDPVIARLVDQAQQRNPSIEAAAQRIEQARAQARVAGAALAPAVDAKSSLQRSATGIPPFGAPRTTGTLSADAAWEIDLFGAARAGRQAAVSRVQARGIDWHDARITLAAEVASTYVALRACEAVAEVQALDAKSLSVTLDLTQRKADAGLSAPSEASLLRASLANANNQVIAQRAECDVLVKSLVFLTGEPEAGLREQLKASTRRMPQPTAFGVDRVPAALLAQRPDLASIERELAAAAAEANVAEADRYPRLTLTGSIGLAAIRLGGATFDGQSWGFGPALSLPLFDAGRRSARVDAARARIAELRAQYMSRAAAAVREVEEALVRLDSAERRQRDAESAVRDFEIFFAAAQTRWNVGVGNIIELEEARRQTLNASAALIQLRRERVAQWIVLYKAMGGGWQPDTKDQAS
jgi:NodT family efflux transporter outer membrane factor (OMF) lipoprotein